MQEQNEQAPASHNPEFGYPEPTAERYTFTSRERGRMDDIYKSEFHKTRLISYQPVDEASVNIRDNAIEKNLVLGEKLTTAPDFDKFKIPNSARPFVYDKSLTSHDALTYTDDEMFNDLGKLLKSLADLGEKEPLKLTGDIGDNVALIEFTRQEDPKLLFVPGFEEKVVPTSQSNDELLDDYAKRVHDEFDDRFMRSAESFIKGFTS